MVHTLAGAGWVAAGEPLCLIGDSGTGKTHLLIGLGIAAAEAGHRVRYVHAARLVNELVEAADERQLTRTIARYGRIDLLVTGTPPLNAPLFRFVFACPSRRKCQDEWTAVPAATTCEQERRSCEATLEFRRPPN